MEHGQEPRNEDVMWCYNQKHIQIPLWEKSYTYTYTTHTHKKLYVYKKFVAGRRVQKRKKFIAHYQLL